MGSFVDLRPSSFLLKQHRPCNRLCIIAIHYPQWIITLRTTLPVMSKTTLLTQMPVATAMRHCTSQTRWRRRFTIHFHLTPILHLASTPIMARAPNHPPKTTVAQLMPPMLHPTSILVHLASLPMACLVQEVPPGAPYLLPGPTKTGLHPSLLKVLPGCKSKKEKTHPPPMPLVCTTSLLHINFPSPICRRCCHVARDGAATRRRFVG